MTTRLETDANTAAERNTVLFRTYWSEGSHLFLAQVFFTPKADIPENLTFNLNGSNFAAQHPQGIRELWNKLLGELKDTDNIIGYCNEHDDGHPNLYFARAWFDAMYYNEGLTYTIDYL